MNALGLAEPSPGSTSPVDHHPATGDLGRAARSQHLLEVRRCGAVPARTCRGDLRPQVRASRPVPGRPGSFGPRDHVHADDAQAAQGARAHQGQGIRRGASRDPGSELPTVRRYRSWSAAAQSAAGDRCAGRALGQPSARRPRARTRESHLVICNGTLVPGDARLDEDRHDRSAARHLRRCRMTAVGSKCKVCKGPAVIDLPRHNAQLLRRAPATAVPPPDGEGDRRLRHAASRPIGSSSRSAAARTPSPCGTCWSRRATRPTGCTSGSESGTTPTTAAGTSSGSPPSAA